MKTRLVVLGGAVALGAAALLVRAGAPRPIASSVPPSSSEALHVPVAAVDALCTFAPGAQLAYRFQLESEVKVDDLPARPIEVSVQATLGFEVVRADSHSAVLVARLRDVTHDLPNVETRELEEPFLVEVSRDCELTRFARHRSTPLAAARRLQSFVWLARFKRTADASYSGQDGTGEYHASLTVDGSRVRRAVQRYDRIWNSTRRDVQAESVLGVTLGATWMASATHKEQLALDGTSTASTLTLGSVTPSFERQLVTEADYVWENLLPRDFGTKQLSRRETAPELLQVVARQTLPEALRGFEERVATQGVEQSWPLLAAFFEVHPEQIAPAVKSLQAGEFSPKAEGLFFTALGATPGDVAREALLSIKRNAASTPMNRARAMFSLVGRADVGEPLSRELAEDAKGALSAKNETERFHGREAALAMSTLSGLQGQPVLKEVTNQTLRELIASADPEGPVASSALKAIGNSGDASLLPVAEPFSRSTNATTRLAATNVVRRMEPAASEAFALEWLGRETDEFIKASLYDVLRTQHLDAQTPPSAAMVSRLMEDLPKTKSGIARKGMIRFLCRSVDLQQPAVREFLVAQAKREHAAGAEGLNEFVDVLTPAEVAEVLR